MRRSECPYRSRAYEHPLVKKTNPDYLVRVFFFAVALFAAVFVGLAYLPAELLGPGEKALSTTTRLIISAVAVAPLVIALLWDRLEKVKFGGFEIALNELT